MKTVIPKFSEAIIHNPGCGILYLQRGRNKVNYEDIAPNSWFFRERLTDKISFSIPWSMIEPIENEYRWEQPDWEKSINSWIKNGFKVALQIRGMGTLGTFYNDGTPQWVFDSGAKHVDEPIRNYSNTYLLNNIPSDSDLPIRYPVYWDEIYLEKVEKLVAAMGQRYNGRPEIEYIGIGHMGRWGEMHIAHNSPMQPWINAGFCLEKYIKTHKRLIDIYLKAFPDTELSQELSTPCFPEDPNASEIFSMSDIEEIINYLSQNNIHLKYNGLGMSHEPASSQFINHSIAAIMQRCGFETKTAVENLVLPEAMTEGLNCGISYWHRGGESEGLGVAKVANDLPISDKKIYSFYRFFQNKYDTLSQEDEKNIWRQMAKKCGYRLTLEKFVCPQTIIKGQFFTTRMRWSNQGVAPCYETFMIRLSLFCLVSNQEKWHYYCHPNQATTSRIWNSQAVINDELSWFLPTNTLSGKYELRIKLIIPDKNESSINLPIKNQYDDGTYKLTTVNVK